MEKRLQISKQIESYVLKNKYYVIFFSPQKPKKQKKRFDIKLQQRVHTHTHPSGFQQGYLPGHMHLTSGCATEEKVSVSGTHDFLCHESCAGGLASKLTFSLSFLTAMMIISLCQQARFHFQFLFLKRDETSSHFLIQAAGTEKLAQTKSFSHLPEWWAFRAEPLCPANTYYFNKQKINVNNFCDYRCLRRFRTSMQN